MAYQGNTNVGHGAIFNEWGSLPTKYVGDLIRYNSETYQWNNGTQSYDVVGTGTLPGSVIQSKTSSFTADVADDVYLINAASPTVATLPAASSASGKIFTFKRLNSTSSTVTIDGNGAETIDGALTLSIPNQYDTISIVCDGASWWVI